MVCMYYIFTNNTERHKNPDQPNYKIIVKKQRNMISPIQDIGLIINQIIQ